MEEEIAKARQGIPAHIFIKVNSVTDRQLIDKLAEASQAGVEVVMNVRGICCLRPGVSGLTDHIRIFSVVGRFLEHPRVFAFGAGEDASMYIGSADFMTRNTERRVEIACPVLDPGHPGGRIAPLYHPALYRQCKSPAAGSRRELFPHPETRSSARPGRSGDHDGPRP